jgi:uncharacterized protein
MERKNSLRHSISATAIFCNCSAYEIIRTPITQMRQIYTDVYFFPPCFQRPVGNKDVILNPDVFCRSEESILSKDGFFTSRACAEHFGCAQCKLAEAFRMALQRLARHLQTEYTTHMKIPEINEYDSSRRQFLRNAALGISAFSFLGAGHIDDGWSPYEIVEQKIRIPNLPPEFSGTTIGLVSDIHSSPYMTKEDMDEYVAVINSLKTDLIVLPGDFVTSKREEVYPFAEAFSQLHAPLGVYGCLGNHDSHGGVDFIAKEVDACGIKLLRNEAVAIRKGSASLNLLGIDDVGWSREPRKELQMAMAAASATGPTILLSHKPYYMDLACEMKIDLTLAGHTHGGQIVLLRIAGFYLAPASIWSKYVAGLYEQDGAQLYVTRGIGSWGIPFRFNCPPEITKIVLS